MKISYFLHNFSGLGRKIPAGEAWQWHNHIEDLDQANTLFTYLKKRMKENRLALANLYVDKIRLSEAGPDLMNVLGDEPVEYNELLAAKRIINKHEDFLEDNSVQRAWTLKNYGY